MSFTAKQLLKKKNRRKEKKERKSHFAGASKLAGDKQNMLAVPETEEKH
jgi:hypothetical protein